MDVTSFADVNIGNTFIQAKAAKRKIDTAGDTLMEVETYRGIEGSTTPTSKNVKRQKPSSEDMRKIPVPAHRYTPLKENWLKIFSPVVEHLQLQIRFNLKTRNVEIRTSNETKDISNLQKAADFVKVKFLIIKIVLIIIGMVNL